jgi:hypothetical protein
MAYVKTTWIDSATPCTAANMNNLETQYDDAVADAATDAAGKVSTHAALTTGVHGVGGGTVAKVADIATDANLSAAAQAAIAASHAQNGDTHLAAQDQDLDMNTHKITGVVDPAAAQDAATKNYVDTAIGGGIPAGVVVMWSGLAAACPSGWHICDGTDGTIDLRGMFIKGAAVNPGATGGAATHTHDNHSGLSHSGTAVASHSGLSHSGAAVGNHTVTQPSGHAAGITAGAGGSQTCNPGTGIVLNYQNHYHATPALSHSGTAVDAHSVTQPSAHSISAHSVTNPSAHSISAHSSENNEPAFYALCFIVKL